MKNLIKSIRILLVSVFMFMVFPIPGHCEVDPVPVFCLAGWIPACSGYSHIYGEQTDYQLSGNYIFIKGDNFDVSGDHIYGKNDSYHISGDHIYGKNDSYHISGNRIYGTHEHFTLSY